MRGYYYGCHGEPGHMLFGPEGHRARWLASGLPMSLALSELDGRFAPKDPHQTEGRAAVHHVDGHTVLSFWDRSADARRGSNSTFVLPGTLDGAAALALARELFPWVFDRITFEVTL